MRTTTSNFIRNTLAINLFVLAAAGQIQESGFITTLNDGIDSGYGSALELSDDTILAVGDPGPLGGNRPGYIDLIDLDTLQLLNRLLPSDSTPDDTFGSFIDVDGDFLVAGASRADSIGVDSGAVYLFNINTGQQIFRFLADDTVSGDRLGGSVAINNRIIVAGAGGDDENGNSSGSAYVFDAETGLQLRKLIAEDGAALDLFGGAAVDIQGAVIAVSSIAKDNQTGAVYIFDALSGLQTLKLTAEDATQGDRFGGTLVLDGDRVFIGASQTQVNGLASAGSVYVFDVNTGQQLAKFGPEVPQQSQSFGNSMVLNGSNLLVGAPGDFLGLFQAGSAYLFDATSLEEVAKYQQSMVGVTEPLATGSCVALSSERVIAGAAGDDFAMLASNGVFFFPRVQQPESYCIATASSSGCSAAISLSSPTLLPASGAADATLQASDVQAECNGQLLYSFSGPAAIPFSGGTLCVTKPFIQSEPQATGGTPGQCDGTLSLSLNNGTSFDPGSGLTGWYQFWYRDSNDSTDTAFSDAIEVDFR